jgi:hypothetical protein
MNDSTVADELAIRSLVARYAEAVSAYDEQMWAATWAENGNWQVMGHSPVGVTALVATWHELMGGFEFVVQQANSGYVDIDGDTARGRWQFVEYGKMKNGGAMINIGFYRDECVKVAGEWRFLKRVFAPLYVGPPDLSGAPSPFPKD